METQCKSNMLDTQVKSCEDNAKMANPMPMEILVNEKIGEKEEETGKLQQKSRKSKSILNWLKNSTTTTTNLITNHQHNSHDSLEINSCQPSEQSTENHTTHQETATCLAHTSEPQPQPPTLIATTHQNGNINNDVTLLREFRGVQTLRHLWNKRITANKESAARAKIYKQQQQQHKQKQFTKSQSCLLSSESRRGEGEESPQPLHFELGFQASPPLRAKSLHDCSGDFETDQDPLDLTVLELEKHLEKDNFYKYKTAEQATKLRELSEQHSSARRFSAGLLFSERFQWLKKPDIFTKRRASEVRSNLASEERSCKENFYSPFQERSGKENCYSHEGDSLLDIVINDFEPTTMLGDSMPAARCQNHTSTTTSNSSSTPMTSPHRLRPDSLHSSDSLASHNSSSTTTGRSSGVVRKNSSTRKYSFKTHQRSYHVRRKMHSGNHNKEHHGSSSSSSSSSTISLVAQLTQQFNERIQQDSSILEQVKRKNGILMTHKGHVFKVVEVDTHAPVGRTLSSHSKLSASLSNSSVSAVQRTIKKFENASRTSAKPKVPQKSSRVLEKSKELIYGKVGNTTKKEKEKGAVEVVKKSKQPPNSLALPKSLEMVKEETKTPLELEMEMERRMAAEKAALMDRGDCNCQGGTGQGLKGYGNGEGEKGDSRDKAERELLDSPRERSKDIKLENGETRNSPQREGKDLRKCQEQRDSSGCQGQGDSKENLEIRGQPMSSEPGIAGNRNENKSFKISPLKGGNSKNLDNTKSENRTTSQESPTRENGKSTEIPKKLGSQNSELYSKVRHKSSFGKDSLQTKMCHKTETHQIRPTSPESPRGDNEYSHRILEFKNSELYGKDTLQTQDGKAPQVPGCENSQHSGQKECKNDQNLPTPPESPREDNGKSPPIPKNLEFQNSSLYRAVGKQLSLSKDAEVAQEQRTSPTRQDDTNELSEESPLKENPKNSKNTDSESPPNTSPKPATIHMNQEFPPQISKKLEFQTSELYPKVRRQSSFAKEEKQRDIIIYIKQDFNKATPDTEPSTLPEDSKSKEKISKKMENPKNENEKKTKVTRRPTTFYQDAHISKKPLQDNRRDILIYIKPGQEQNPDELAKQTALGRNASFNSTEPKRVIKRANLSKEEIELAQEVKEKLSNLPRFANNKSMEEATSSGGKTAENSVQQRKLKTSQSVFYETLTTSEPKSPIAEQPEEGKKSKHKHSTFYEKLKIFTKKANHNKNNSTPTSPKAEEETKTLDSGTANEQPQPQSPTALNYTPMSSPRPKQKMITKVVEEVNYSEMYVPQSSGLLDALQQVEEKICSLSKPEGQTKEQQEGETLNEPPTGTDDFRQPLKPNTSFLHQTYSKVLTKPGGQIIQAVNVSLVNAIEGEQMELMEQKEIQQSQMTEKDENTPPEEKLSSPEPLYEPIEASTPTPRHQEEDIYQTVEELQKEIENHTETSKTTSSHLETLSKPLPPDAEEIYQTVEELQREVETTNETIGAQTPAKETNAKPELLDDYEVIGDPNLISTPTETPPKIPADFDGYEEYAPSVETIPITTCNTMRKTTDELPDLPEPKRKINKPAPNLPLQPHICPKLPPIPTEIYATSSNNNVTLADDSHHYYADEEENIYDTIKGSDCYESIQPHNNNNNNAAPCNNLTKSSSNSSTTKNSDTQSISNCYESISHFKPPRPISISQHSGSSRGSTLTISSEHKTNSLYEDGSIGIIGMTSSSSSSLRYSSQRLYRSQHHREEDGGGAAGANDSAGSSNYNSSMGRASDVSEEWMDISDNEENDETNWKPKPKYQIVCEKAHKSPSWSRRVREKRLHHQRKSRSYIEDDDPDHYYEQLSPGDLLNKRHSLALQERGGSLQRNQNMVRISKRGKPISYSAHALGQEISDDSFDSDTDDYYEGELQHTHNDSGVDIRTSKLPDPPVSSNQKYSIVKKFRNFLAKKSPNSSKHGGSQQKIDDNASQFYVNGNFHTSNGGGGSGSGDSSAKPMSLQAPQTKELSTSEKNLILAQSNITKAEQLNTSTTPRKPKTGKSLRHRIRKSLVGFDKQQLATLTPTRSTFYVEDPVQIEDVNGQMDSGFSEKVAVPSNEVMENSTNTTNDTHKYLTARKAKKEGKLSANAQRRRTSIGIRPIEPPPPPPDGNGNMKRQSTTSWYAECGVFKNGTTNLVGTDSQLLNGETDNGNGGGGGGTSWYEEAGLYQTSGISVASSSGSSGVSTSNEANPGDDMSHSLFSNEPLYQIYSAAKLEAISRDMHDNSSTDGYEEIGERRKSAANEAEKSRKTSRPTALQLIEPKSGPERTLWSQIPEVVNSMILPTLTPRERALMEAKFEIITSEASYLKSLNLLRSHYMNHPVFRDQNLVNSRDRKALFAHIVPVHECSERLLSELESCWQDNIMLIGLSKRIYAIAEKHFHVYIGFCENQGRMDRTLKRLRANKGLFAQNLELLESSPLCCGLNLHSFLMLPMQRITRLPLLIDAVFSKCHPNDDEYENWKMCLAIMNKIVTQCNEAATKSDQAYEIEKISRQLEFNPSVIRPLAIAPAGVLAPGTKPRYLVKKGEFTHLIWRGDDAKLTFGKKFTKTTIYAFLFSDLLVLTKRKGEEQFSVFDYCPRNMLTITSGDSLPQVPTKDLNSQTSKNLILMTLLENHQRKTNELLLSCPSVSEQERWLQAMRPPESETPGEKLYEQWDCPQVIAKHAYESNEPDGLNLEIGDVVNVTRKLPDGWYQGERIRDGAVGWFPGDYTEEVNSAHVRARNLKLRHRLLTFTATYLESQKRNK